MKKSQTNSAADAAPGTGVDLLLELRGAKRRAGLTEAFRDAVRSGRLLPGTRLPASRTLAADLGLARSTVTESYAELVAEGWFTARQGSGTHVAHLTKPHRESPRAARARPTVGLLPGAADFGEFPYGEWLAASGRALTVAPPDAFGYGDPLGRMELRTALAEYLARVRGVQTEPGRIVICSGFHHGLTLIARALHARGVRAVAVESYGLDLYRTVLADAGMSIPPLRVDDDGACVDDVTDLRGVEAMLLTPAHQFPTGVALSPERRLAAIAWARLRDGVILEDDYDGEFRYDRKPVGALQGLDPERVIYFGTASKSLAPALRMAWMVVPGHLLADVAHAKGPVEVVSVLDQLTLAAFITSGVFDRHVRGRRQTYRRRRDQLVTALARSAPHIRMRGLAAGLQAVLELPPGTEQRMLQRAADQGLTVSPLSEFRHEALDEPQRLSDGLVVNYAAVADSAWPGALAGLCAALAPVGDDT